MTHIPQYREHPERGPDKKRHYETLCGEVVTFYQLGNHQNSTCPKCLEIFAEHVRLADEILAEIIREEKES